MMVSARISHLVFLVLLAACHGEEGEQSVPEMADVGPTFVDMADSGDVRAEMGAPPESEEPDFVCQRGIEEVDVRDEYDEDFRIYPRGTAPITRRSDLVEEGHETADGKLSSRGSYLGAPVEMNPGRGALRAMYTEAGQEVRIQGALWTSAEIDATARLSLTLMVNYRPVAATYHIRGPENEVTFLTVEDTGVRAPMTEDFVSFEIVVPGNNFAEPGIYDVSLWAYAYKPSGLLSIRRQRISLFAGGYRIPEHPCFVPSEYQAPTELERDIYELIFRGAGILYPTDLESRSQLFDEDYDMYRLPADPGEQKDLVVFLGAQARERHKVVWVPLLDGRPVGPPRFNYLPANRDLFGPAFRDTIQVEMPDSAGVADVVIAQWYNPFEPRADRFGEHLDLPPIPVLSGTNYLHFEVSTE